MRYLLLIVLALVLLVPFAARPQGVVVVKRISATGTPTPSTFPINAVLDNFNRANEGPPPSANWTSKIDSADSGGCSVVSNQLKCVTNGSSWWSAASFGPNVECYLTVPNIGSFSSGWAVYGRIAGAGTASPNSYRVYADGGSGLIFVQRLDAGAPTTLGANISQVVTDGDSIGIQITGTTIKAYFCASGGSCGVGGAGWTVVGTRTDATYSAAGRIGIFSANGSLVADNFGGGTF